MERVNILISIVKTLVKKLILFLLIHFSILIFFYLFNIKWVSQINRPFHEKPYSNKIIHETPKQISPFHKGSLFSCNLLSEFFFFRLKNAKCR